MHAASQGCTHRAALSGCSFESKIYKGTSHVPHVKHVVCSFWRQSPTRGRLRPGSSPGWLGQPGRPASVLNVFIVKCMKRLQSEVCLGHLLPAAAGSECQCGPSSSWRQVVAAVTALLHEAGDVSTTADPFAGFAHITMFLITCNTASSPHCRRCCT